jgi:hypothetical protein
MHFVSQALFRLRYKSRETMNFYHLGIARAVSETPVAACQCSQQLTSGYHVIVSSFHFVLLVPRAV